MTALPPLQLTSPNVLQASYVIAFGVAAVACWASVLRARRITDPDTRRSLIALLVTSGGWAAAHVAFLLVPSTGLKIVFYQIGLVVGISAVGPWLAFCSAYTGRTLHRSSIVQLFAVGLFLGLVAVKVTNPWHGLYFQTVPVADPFSHLAVNNQLLHWLAMGFAYALATVGYFMLFERFWQVGRSTVPLAALAGLTGLPLVLDLVALSTDWLIELTYEPLGVAAFAVGVLFLYVDTFETVRLTGSRNRPVIVVDADDQVREFNQQAASLFSNLEPGRPVSAVLPETPETGGDDPVMTVDHPTGPRYYQLTGHEFAAGGSQLGRIITLSDVTEREQYRDELERQNDRLERFASMVSHDLRNPLTVAKGRVELAREEHPSEDLERASEALDRMEALIEDVLDLARQGQPIGETERVSLVDIADACWNVVATEEASLTVTGDLTFEADRDRLQQLLENLFRNAVEHGGETVTITVDPLESGDGFAVEDDGPGIPPDQRESVFEFGYSTEADGTGFGLPIVREIARAHDWTVAVTEGADGGARFVLTGVNLVDG